MKKTLLTLLVLAGISSANTANAQLADGSIAPDWTLTDINGTSHNLYSLLDNGYSVVIDLNATWCGPCLREIPALKILETDYHDKNIAFVSLSIDEVIKIFKGV